MDSIQFTLLIAAILCAASAKNEFNFVLVLICLAFAALQFFGIVTPRI